MILPTTGWVARVFRWPPRSVGRARRAFEMTLPYLVERKQFGQQIGKFQGVSFQPPLDMITEIDAADFLTLNAAWQLDQGRDGNREIAKRSNSMRRGMLARVTDTCIQLHGGMGLMDDLPFAQGSGVMRVWNVSGMAHLRSSAISSAVICYARQEANYGLTRLISPAHILLSLAGRGRVMSFTVKRRL